LRITPNAPTRSRRGGGTAAFKFYELRDNLRPPVEYEEVMTRSPQRPCGPPEADRPALPEGAPADLGHYEETTKQSL
jgi:hypothetical protein